MASSYEREDDTPILLDKSSFINKNCTEIRHEPKVYTPRMKTTYDDGKGWLRKCQIGKRDKSRRDKVIMLVGATGSGKSTTINAILNYISAVDWDDNFRLKLIAEDAAVDQSKSVTNGITAYTLHHQIWYNVDYSLTIIDTPGFGDTRGITRDEEIKTQIETFFRNKGSEGIDIIDAVGVVVPAEDQRLTPTQKYVFESVMSLFGKDIAENIFLFCTFAGPGKKPPGVLKAIDAAKIPYKGYFKFNHDGLFDFDDDDNGAFTERYYKMGTRSFKSFFEQLDLVEPKSLQLTREVMDERNKLEDALRNIQENILLSINELEKLNKEKKILKQHHEDIKTNKDFTYEIMEQYVETEPLTKGYTAINCKTCNITCLKTKYPWTNASLKDCWLFRDKTGEQEDAMGCTKCPGECQWADHRCENLRYVIKTKRVTKTLEDLRRNYEEARGMKMTAEQIILECAARIEEVREETVKFVRKAKQCIEKLDEIALKPDPLSTEDYIDLMIESEKAKAGEDLAKRIETLMQLKKLAKMRRSIRTQSEPDRNVEKEKVLCEDPLKEANMTYVVDEVKREPGYFLGTMRKIFKKLNLSSKVASKKKGIQE